MLKLGKKKVSEHPQKKILPRFPVSVTKLSLVSDFQSQIIVNLKNYQLKQLQTVNKSFWYYLYTKLNQRHFLLILIINDNADFLRGRRLGLTLRKK